MARIKYLFRGKQYRQEKKAARKQKRQSKKVASTRTERKKAKEVFKQSKQELKDEFPQDLSKILLPLVPLRFAMETIMKEQGISYGNSLGSVVNSFARNVLKIPDLPPNLFMSRFDPVTIGIVSTVVTTIIDFFKNLKENKSKMPPKTQETIDKIDEVTNEILETGEELYIEGATDDFLTDNKQIIFIGAGIALFLLFSKK